MPAPSNRPLPPQAPSRWGALAGLLAPHASHAASRDRLRLQICAAVGLMGMLIVGPYTVLHLVTPGRSVPLLTMHVVMFVMLAACYVIARSPRPAAARHLCMFIAAAAPAAFSSHNPDLAGATVSSLGAVCASGIAALLGSSRSALGYGLLAAGASATVLALRTPTAVAVNGAVLLVIVSLVVYGLARLLEAEAAQRERMQERLLVQNRLATMGTLIAGLGHEINNPLAYVVTNIDVARESDDLPDDVREALDDAFEGANRLARVVRDLKLLGRTDERQVAVDVAPVVESSLAIASVKVERGRVRVVKDVDAVPPVLTQPGELRALLLNLFTNAMEAVEDRTDGEVRVAVTLDELRRVVIAVEDNGGGVRDEDAERIFEPFVSTRAAKGGTGLGLAIGRSIVERANGTLAVDQSPTLGGARFVVTLPAVADAPAPTPAAPTPAGGRRVLIVDDEVRVGDALARALRGHHVTVVNGGEAALEVLDEAERFDLILCDVAMPGMDGLQLLDHIKARWPAHADQLCFLTGGVSRESTRRGLEASGRPVLTKPIGKHELLALLEPTTEADAATSD
jgi:signal transduction histidine kinase/ActR/RegA family two-component response regulator